MTRKCTATDWRTLGLFAATSFAAVGVGSYALALHGAEVGTWSRNLLAWLAGLVLSGPLILFGRSRGLSFGIILVTVLGLTASLLAQGQSGVYRWLDLGPLHINIAALLLPVTLVALSTASISPPVLLAMIGVIGAVLVAQPDASQATAFLLASSPILSRRPIPKSLRFIALIIIGGIAIAAWLRPDPLQPVPEVEGIFPLISQISLPLAAAAGLALVLTCLAPLQSLSSLREGRRPAAIVLATYFLITALMPFVGSYPVPLVGAGMSFPVGFWLATALISAREHPTG